jgi:flavin reductase (DIM6/NTAB) family NADH-FMN oxidoreductase RutF
VPIDSQTQRRIMGHFATGVTVVTTRHDDQLAGMTANAVASLSLDPPLLLVAVDKRAAMHGHLLAGQCFTVNVLRESQVELSNRFARSGPKEFADIPLRESSTGAPVFAEALAWAECRLQEVLPGGDHDIFLGEIVAGDAHDGHPLMYFRGKYTRLAE